MDGGPRHGGYFNGMPMSSGDLEFTIGLTSHVEWAHALETSTASATENKTQEDVLDEINGYFEGAGIGEKISANTQSAVNAANAGVIQSGAIARTLEISINTSATISFFQSTTGTQTIGAVPSNTTVPPAVNQTAASASAVGKATEAPTVAPNSATGFGRELLNQGSSFGQRLTDGISNLAVEVFKWGLDVLNAGVDRVYNGQISDARWKPLSSLTTDARPTVLGLDQQVLVSTAHGATLGIPGGIYNVATGNYQKAQDLFGAGALTLISANVAGVQSPNIGLPAVSSAQARWVTIQAASIVSDGTLVGRLPNPHTATAPMTPPAVYIGIGAKPVPGAGPPPKR